MGVSLGIVGRIYRTLKERFLRYTTFDGKITFAKSVAPAVLTLLVGAIGFLFTVIEYGVTASGVLFVSLFASVVLLVAILYYTIDAAKRTVDPEFYSWTGMGKVIVGYIVVGIVAVSLLHLVGVILREGVGSGDLSFTASAFNIAVVFIDLTIPEVVLGGSLVLLVAGSIALTNSVSLSSFPRLSEVLERFRSISENNLDKIDYKIVNIGHVPRSETSRLVEGILDTDDPDNFILKGRGGVGKSGILKKVCEECDYEILFIDVSSSAAISSEDELVNELNLDASLERCVQQVAVNQPLLVVFDQLDDADRQAGAVYKDLILKVAKIDGVSTIFACRSYELEHYDEFSAFSSSSHFGTPISVGTLSETKVREYLEQLGVESASPDLVQLCEEIEYLDVVGRLVEGGTDLDQVNDQVHIWNEYRELIAEDHPSDDQFRGTRVVGRAVEYAVEATEGGSVFSVNDIDWIDEQLISNGVIQGVTETAGETSFRFRHQQFQLYLYAWNKVQEAGNPGHDNPFWQSIEELDEGVNNDVVKWMFAIYTGEGEGLPEGTAAFVQEILDPEEGFEFYWASKIADVLKKWDATENQTITQNVLDNLENRENLYKYFFDEETDPSWIEALAETGRFQDPPDHLLGYLRQAAGQYPEVVSRIVRDDLDGLDRRGRATVVSIIQELPIEYGAELADIIDDGLTSPESIVDLYYSRAAEFTEHLLNEEYFDEGLELVETLLLVRLHGTIEESAYGSMSSYYLKSLFEDGTLERLVRARPKATIGLFEDQMREAARVRGEERGRDVDDFVLLHLRSVSYYNLEESERYQPFELFIGLFRTTLDIWCEEVTEEVCRQKIEEYLEDTVIFRGFGFYLLRQYCETYQDLVAEELVREENYRDYRLRKEFQLLLKHGFASLDHDQQQGVIDVITSVPVRESLGEAARERQDRFKEMEVEEIVEQESARWIRDRLWPIRESLSGEADEMLSDLLERFEDEPEDPEVDAVRGGFVSHESPEPRSDLEDMAPGELIDFCIEEPFEEEETFEANSITEVGQRGTAETVADIILDDPERYAGVLPRLDEAAPVYAVHLLGHLRDRMDDDPEIIASELFRENLWRLSEEIVVNTDEWPSHARKRVGWVLRDGFGDTDLFEYFLSDEDRVRDIMFTLLDDPDPDIEQDRPPEDYAGYNDPSHTALNTVRPVALDALIIYAFRKWAGEDTGFDADVADHLEQMLDDISLGVHSVFGRQFRQLWATDKGWVQDQLSTIFPRSQSRQDIDRFTAAWDSYVAFNKVDPRIFPELREYYFHAIDLMAEGEHTETVNAEQRMAGHLLFNYLYEYDVEEWSESLLAYLYDRSDPELARHVAWHLWKHGGDLDEDDAFDLWEKTRVLWEKRLEQVADDETYSDEISWFVEWIEYVENRITLEEVEGLLRKSAIHITDNMRAWETTEAYLAQQADQSPELAVDVFHVLAIEFERPARQEFSEEVATILRPGFERYEQDHDVYQDAFEIAQQYASEGYSAAQRFIDTHR